ncbi:hypothetical protein ACSSS7_003317 [Eimeria intestinalis]
MESNTLIVDNGSGYIKAGTNAEDLPSLFFPTVVGVPRRRFQEQYREKPLKERVFVGEQAIANRQHLTITNPIDHGHIDDWEQMGFVWQHIYDQLEIDPSSSPVLLTEPPNCSLSHRNRLAESFLEGFQVPELNLSVTGLMAIYGSGVVLVYYTYTWTGRTTGMVVDIGEGVTQCVPVFDGYLEASSLKRSDFGGQELQMYLQKILCDMGYAMTTRDDFEHVRVIKETLCFCSLDPATEQQRTDLEKSYHLPDGLTLRDGETTPYASPWLPSRAVVWSSPSFCCVQAVHACMRLSLEVTLGPERFYPAEALFNPQLCGRDNPSLTDLLWSSVRACPIESRKSLVASVVLCGGSSLFPGFPER